MRNVGNLNGTEVFRGGVGVGVVCVVCECDYDVVNTSVSARGGRG